MSLETYEAVADAIRAHVADLNPNLYVTDWYVVSASVDATDDNETHYVHIGPPVPLHTQVGLLSIATRRLLSDDAD